MILDSLSVFELSLSIIILLILVIILFFILLKFGWFWQQIREISKPENTGGYTKFVQLVIIGILFTSFIGSFIYYWITKELVTAMTVLFTVIVGWLGMVIGRFFGESAMDIINKQRESYAKEVKSYARDTESFFKDYRNIMSRARDYLREYLKKE